MIPATIKLRASLATLGAACALAFAPAAAHANQYVVDHCKNWDSDAGGVAFPSVTGATTDTCGAGGVILHQLSGGQKSMAPDTSVAIGLSIPADRPNIVIERVQSLYSAAAATTVTPNGGTPFLAVFNHLGQQAANDVPPDTPPLDTLLPAGARSLTWSLYCANDAAGNPCTFAEETVLRVHKTRLFLNESVAPTVTVNGGTLVGAGAKSGQSSVIFDASDTDSGVASMSVTLGTTVVGAVEYSCAFKDWSACQRDRTSQVLQVDTMKVPDGSHELLITVIDAAKNAVTRSLGAVTVANGPGPPVPNGSPASRLAKVSARFATTRARTRLLRFGQQPTIRGRLVNEQNQPIGGATIAVLQRRRQSGADPVQVATVQTAPDGSFSHKLSSGPSRTVTFAYSAFAGDAKPTAAASLRTVVRAIVSAGLTPRSVRAGGQVTMVGRLRLLPREGVEIKIQARDGRRWRTIDDVKTRRGGSFRWRYRFKSSGAGRTFGFRARVASPVYPFASGSSKPMFVRVR